MRRKNGDEEEPENHERWMLSYADFVTLLMIFFIIMYSMSNVDSAKYKQIASGLSSAMGGGNGVNIISTGGGVSAGKEAAPIDTNIINMTEEQSLEKVKGNVDKYIKDSALSDSVETSIEDRGLVLSFKDSLFFSSGNSDVKPEEVKKLVEIGKLLNQSVVSKSFIRVEGHADNVPIKNSIYKSNLNLSAIRASNVAQILIDKSGIKADRISVVGYGEYRPKATNNTEAGRAANRRVDIIIMNSQYNEVENNKK